MLNDKKPIETSILSFPFPDLQMVKVSRQQAGASFLMGDANSEYDDEKPVHPVSIQYDYYIGQFTVTQRLYASIMEETPSYYKGDSRPVEQVSWEDTKKFIEKLNHSKDLQDFLKKNDFIGWQFRLPSEAEWEYAARGGKYNQGYEYCGSDDLKQVGWYGYNSGGETKPIGLLMPNELGIYDMSGNIIEWCEDDWHDTYDDAPDDGSAWIDKPNRGAYRVVRGGYYFGSPVFCRPARRIADSPGSRNLFIGFRLVFSPSTGKPI